MMQDDESRIPSFMIDNENAKFIIDEQQIKNTLNYWNLPIDLNKKYHFEIQTSLQSMGGPNMYTFKVLVDRQLELVKKDFFKSRKPLNAVLYASYDLSSSFRGSLENFTVMR